ncbi:hypothetical protein C3E98_024690 [Pseudomonas sp. MWU13-2625]|nr:hypothetical protein C3E98_024690 [Pseudomonas sp. MWU13-2625]
MKLIVKPLLIAIPLLSMSTLLANAQAGEPQTVGPTEGRCTATGVVEDSRVLGYCVVDGVKKAWYRSTSPAELINLKPLQPNQSCESGFLALNIITGNCDQSQGAVPVFWPVASAKSEPQPFKPLPTDTGSVALAATLFGNVAGQSLTPSGSTAVIWRFEKRGDPVQVSGRNDNCRVAAIADSVFDSSTPVALNCPDGSGITTATIATYNGSNYTMKALKLPANASYCEVIGINGNNQVAGTCHYTGSTKATFWPQFDAEPKTLVFTDNLPTEAAFFNSNGSVIANAITPDKRLPVYWPASAVNGQQIPLPPKFDFCLANAIAQSVDTLLMTCAANDITLPVTAFTWNPSSGLSSIQPAPGAGSYRGTAITNSAQDAVGHFKATPQANFQAFISKLP